MEHQSFHAKGTHGSPRSKFDIFLPGHVLTSGPLLWSLKRYLADRYAVSMEDVYLQLVYDLNISPEPLISDDDYTVAYNRLLNAQAFQPPNLPAREIYWEDIEEERVI